MYVWKGWGDWWWNCKNVCWEAPASNPNTDKAHVLIDPCLLNVALWASETRLSLLIRVGMCDYKPQQGKRWSCGEKKAQRELWGSDMWGQEPLLDDCPWVRAVSISTHGMRGHFSSFEVCNHNRASKEDGSNNYKERSRGYRVFQYIPNKNELIGSQTEQADAIIRREVS